MKGEGGGHREYVLHPHTLPAASPCLHRLHLQPAPVALAGGRGGPAHVCLQGHARAGRPVITAVHTVRDAAHTAAPPRVCVQHMALPHVSVEVPDRELHLISALQLDLPVAAVSDGDFEPVVGESTLVEGWWIVLGEHLMITGLNGVGRQ